MYWASTAKDWTCLYLLLFKYLPTDTRDIRYMRDKPEQKIFLESIYWSWNALSIVTKFYIYNCIIFRLLFMAIGHLSDIGDLKRVIWWHNIHYCISSLRETLQGWKFWLTPRPSLRSMTHKVIRENLLYIPALFAFKLGHAIFPTCIICLHTTAY